MSNSSAGWFNKQMRHDDGRRGIITSEFVGFMHVALTITIEGTAETEYLQLNSDGKDSGALGWNWRYSREGEPEAWAHLGDHNPPAKVA